MPPSFSLTLYKVPELVSAIPLVPQGHGGSGLLVTIVPQVEVVHGTRCKNSGLCSRKVDEWLDIPEALDVPVGSWEDLVMPDVPFEGRGRGD